MGSDDSEEENRDRVLAPEDLDITAQPEVEEIDDGRYVVSPDGPAKKPNKDLLDNPDWLDSDEDEEPAPQREQSQQPDQSRSQQPQDDRSSPTRQSTGGGNQSGGRGQQSSGSPQSGGRGQQPSSGSPQSGGRGQQPSSGSPQSGGRNQQPSSGNPQSGGRNQQPSSGNPQSGGRNQQPSSGNPQSGGRSQPSSGSPQSGGRNQQPSSGSPQSGDPNRQSAGTSQPTDGASSPPSSSDIAAHNQPPVEPPAVELTNENVSKFLAEELTQGSGDYGFDATLNVEGQVNRGRMTSDDVGETLETLLRWYARQTTDEVEPEAVLGIILAGSDLAVEYPVQSAYAMVKQFDLQPDDTISDLLSAIRKEGSFTIPPSKE